MTLGIKTLVSCATTKSNQSLLLRVHHTKVGPVLSVVILEMQTLRVESDASVWDWDSGSRTNLATSWHIVQPHPLNISSRASAS